MKVYYKENFKNQAYFGKLIWI